MTLNTSIGRLRMLGIIEGISLLVLLFIAMPLKYMAGKPEAVKVIGWIHGLLFILFMIAVLVVFFQRKWKFSKLLLAFLAAFFPFGTFVFDAQLRKEERDNNYR
jgi:integral membrane protein